jgi:hypothetical protein
MQDKFVAEIDPVILRNDLHQILFDPYWLRVQRELESACEPQHMRVHNNAIRYTVGDTEYDVAGLARDPR